jgi:hypothetical protein
LTIVKCIVILQIMSQSQSLTIIAVRVVGAHIPGNWDRPLGYGGQARFVAIYWDFTSDDAFITDGLTGQAGGAWWLYTNLVDHESRQEFVAALMACGADLQSGWPLGDSENEAGYCLILDRYDHALWVARLSDTVPFLGQQHRMINGERTTMRSVLSQQKKEIFDHATVRPTLPCHCARGWTLSGNYYVPCSECQRSGRIEVIPTEVIL